MEALRDAIIDGLRRQGWSRIDAENEADHRIELMRQKALWKKEPK